MSLAGGVGGAFGANSIAKVQQDEARQAQGIQQNISGLETSANAQRKQQMELEARRSSLEQFRNMQRVRAQGLNAAVQQGAQMGTGLAGGQGQATDQGLFNVSGINQNLQIGRSLFGIDDQITQQKQNLSNVQTAANIQLSGLQSNQATYQGISQVGGALTKSAGTISNIFGGGSSGGGNFNFLFGGGSPSGYGK